MCLVDVMPQLQDKPGIADKIIARTHSFVCPITDVTMYEDIKHKSKHMDRHEEIDSIAQSGRSEAVVRPQKKAKAAKAVKDKENVSPAEKSFSVGHIKTLEKFDVAYKKMIDELNKQKAQMEDDGLASYMPAHLIAKQMNTISNLKVDYAEMRVSMEAGQGNFLDIKTRHGTSFPTPYSPFHISHSLYG